MPIADHDASIRDRAYELWKSEGRPHGREHEHWAEARRQVEAEHKLDQPLFEQPNDMPPAAAKAEPDEIIRLRRALYDPEPFSFDLFGSECPAIDLPILLRSPHTAIWAGTPIEASRRAS